MTLPRLLNSVLSCCALAAVAATRAALPEGESLFGENAYQAFTVTGAEPGRIGLEVAEVSGPGFSKALRVRTLVEGPSFPKVTAVLANREPFVRGDVLLARFFLRTVESPRESGEGGAQFELEDAGTSNVSGQFAAHAVREWREILVPLRVVRDCPAGRAVINFRVGDQRQVIEIGGLQVTGFGSKVKFDALPATPVLAGYEGAEAGAPWRAAARERIERQRKSDLRIEVTDAAGRPVPGAEVRVRQQGHAYRFGSAVRADLIVADTPQGEAYRGEIRRFFTAVTFENDLKWGKWLADPQTPQAAARWTEANHILLRGHTMVWARNTRVPEALKGVLERPELLARAINDHITEIAKTMSPRVAVWDVLNEPFRNRDFMNVLGDEAMVAWFQAAHAAAPEAGLFVNDYGIISGGGMDERHQASYEQNVEFLLKAGAPLGGLGFQGHFGRILTPPERLLAILDRYGRFGREMELTEYSTQIDDPELSAAYLRDVLTVFFSHPLTSGFILWGFRENSGYKHSSVLLTKDGALTPAGRVWLDLIYKDWWTNADLRTDAAGAAALRGFNGRYEIEVALAGSTAKSSITLAPGSPPVRLQLPATPAVVRHP